MPFYLILAFKNIFRDRRRSFTLGINYFFVSLLLFLVFSLTQGVKKNISENIVASAAGHITISGEYIVKGRTYQGIRNYPRIDSVVHAAYPQARIESRYTVNSAVYYQGLSKRLSFVGIDSGSGKGLRDQITITAGSWNAFVNQPNAVVLPTSVAAYFGIKNADELLLATRSRFGAFNTGTVQVRGIYKTGNYFLREQIISHFDFIRNLDLADARTASTTYIFFKDLRAIPQKRDRLLLSLNNAGFIAEKPAGGSDALSAVSSASPRNKIQDESVNQTRLTLSTIDEVTGIVTKVVTAINGIGLFVASVMLFIIAVSIFINMRMTITERMHEIGTLRAIGAERKDVVAMFIAESVFLGLVFIAAGIVFGMVLIAVFSTIATFPSEGTLGLFLNKGHFVLKPTVAAVGGIVAALVGLTALFSFFPARYGGNISAAQALNKAN
jgi:putative ABC transport system permease protein